MPTKSEPAYPDQAEGSTAVNVRGGEVVEGSPLIGSPQSPLDYENVPHDPPSGCSLLPHGSIASSAVNIAQVTLGAGMLSMPAAFRDAGGVLALFLIAFCCVASTYSMRLLAMVVKKTHKQTYEELAKHLVHPHFQKVTAIMIAFLCFGVTVVYLIALGDLLHPLTDFESAPSWLKGEQGRRIVISVFWFVFMYPLSMLKQINSLRYVSFLGLLTIFLLLGAILYKFHTTPGAGIHNIKPVNLSINMVASLPVFFFSTCSQANMFEVYHEMHARSPNRMGLASGVAMFIAFIVYSTAGLAGLATFGQGVDANIMSNYQLYTDTTGGYLMIVSFIGFAVTLTVSFPICSFPVRDAILQMLKYPSVYDTPTHVRLILCTCIVTASLVVALFVKQILIVFSLVGGICGSCVAFIWPSVFAIKSGFADHREFGWGRTIIVWGLLVFGVVAGALGTVVSCIQQF